MDTIVKISKERFESLGGYDLGRELIWPAIQQVRGQSLQKKKEVYDRLTPGQRSLFSFWVMHGHTQSGWLQLYIEGYGQYLPMIKHALAHLNDQALLDNLDAAEKIYLQNENFLKVVQDALVKPTDTGQEILLLLEAVKRQFEQVDQALFSLLEETIQKIEGYIRAAPDEFVVFIN